MGRGPLPLWLHLRRGVERTPSLQGSTKKWNWERPVAAGSPAPWAGCEQTDRKPHLSGQLTLVRETVQTGGKGGTE